MKTDIPEHKESNETSSHKKIIYRRKWELVSFDIDADSSWFNLIIENPREVIPCEDMPNEIDLSNVPVVVIGGNKWKQQERRLEAFRQESPDFKWVILLLPYSWSNGRNDGRLLVPSKDILQWKKVSGEKITIAEENFRFLSNGTCMADQVKKLWWRIVETLQEVEKDPGAERIAEILSRNYAGLTLPLYDEIQQVIKTLQAREYKSTLLSWEKQRDMGWRVKDVILTKLKELHITKISEIPEDFSISAKEVAPELYDNQETLWTIIVPGLGQKDLIERQTFFIGDCAMVELSVDELTSITDWPYTNIGIKVPGICGWDRFGSNDLEHGELHDLLFVAGENRWRKILDVFQKKWIENQRRENYPQKEQVADAHQTQPGISPDAVVRGVDFITKKEFVAYPALDHEVYTAKWYIRDNGRRITRFDSQEEADSIDRSAREEAKSYTRSREIQEELKTNEIIPFPFIIPEPYQKETVDNEYIMSLTGLDKESYVIEEKTGYRYSKGSNGYRDNDREYQPGTDAWAWFTKKEDGKIHIGLEGFSHLFEWFRIKDTWAQGLLQALELPKQKIEEIKQILEHREEQRFAAYQQTMASVKKQITFSEVFSYLPKVLQDEIVDHDFFHLSVLKEKIEKNWSQAVHLMGNKNVLVNRGGHFRRMWAANNEDYFVVSYDGLIRKADKIEYRKWYFDEGEKLWDVIGQSEVALYYSQYEWLSVIKPALAYTEEQIKVIEEIKTGLMWPEVVYQTESQNKGSEEPETTPVDPEEPEREITSEDLKNLQARFQNK